MHTMAKKLIPYFRAVKEYAVPMVGIIFAILNIYLNIKLNPVLSDLRDIVHRVDAVEEKVQLIKDDCRELKLEILSEIKYLRSRVDSLK